MKGKNYSFCKICFEKWNGKNNSQNCGNKECSKIVKEKQIKRKSNKANKKLKNKLQAQALDELLNFVEGKSKKKSKMTKEEKLFEKTLKKFEKQLDQTVKATENQKKLQPNISNDWLSQLKFRKNKK